MGPALSRVPAPVVAAQLAARCEELVRELFPDARPHGAELRWHARGGAVCSMVMRGGKRGVWANWGDPDAKGDALELVHHELFPDETGRRDSIRWAARWLGIDVMLAEDPTRMAQLHRLTVEALERGAQHAEAAREGKQASAKAMWLAGTGDGRGPEIASYLKGRGIDVAELPGNLAALRFTWDAHFDFGELLPAMLAAIVSTETCKHIGTQMTFLRFDRESGGWCKAGVDPAKKTRGMLAGGVVPLLRGRSGKPLHEASEGDAILIAEGIENALACWLSVADIGEPRVVACLGVSNLDLTLPPTIKTVFLAFDRDGENETVRRARDRACKRYKREGRTVETLKPPPGVKDFADYITHEFWGAL